MEIITTQRVRATTKGSMLINIKKEATDALQLKKGDLVQLTMKKIQNEKTS